VTNHCRDCRHARVKPFVGKLVWGDWMRNTKGGLGVFFDSTYLITNERSVGPVRCAKRCWTYHKHKDSSEDRPAEEKMIKSVERILGKDNVLGKMAQVCQFFDDMREEEK